MTPKISISNPIVSVDWLNANLQASNLIVLNATIPKVTGRKSDEIGYQIPNSLFFDIKKKFSVLDAEFPNTFPSLEQFNREAQALGINNDSAIVVYDELGIYSSARAWWLFKAFGYDNVAVLDGGLPEWKKYIYPTESKHLETSVVSGNFIGNYKQETMCFFNDIVDNSKQSESIILDARSKNRFDGVDPEPRKGLRSGTIPNSINVPFKDVLVDQKLKPESELRTLFTKLARPGESLYLSCGSGITACVLALAATTIGYKHCSVYDGSWTEYGSLTKNNNTMNWTKDELIAYILLFAANSDFNESNLERNVIISKVDMQTFSDIHTEFDTDNDYQSIQKIQVSLKEHHYSLEDLDALFVDIKALFYADGEFDILEQNMFLYLKKVLS